MLYPNMPSVRLGSEFTGLSRKKAAVLDVFLSEPSWLWGARNW
jgi:hypothetical protein